MTPTLEDIQNGSIYEEKYNLSSRIDFTWSVYKDRNYNKEDREKALNFLICAFDIQEPNNINQELILLMEQKNKYRGINNDYIPGKAPNTLPFDPAETPLVQITNDLPPSNPKIQDAIASKELLDVGSRYKTSFDPKNTDFLNDEDRAKYRVHIRNGLFVKNGKNFDTSSMSSKLEHGFAAFTLNANGELSVFTHERNRIYHSSMNSGAPVLSAGELMIKDGVLLKITTSSGHYQPSLFNMYRALEYFSLQGINIDQTKVITFTKPPLKNVEPISITHTDRTQYETKANQIYLNIKQLIDYNIKSINKDILDYNNGSLIDSIYELKDKITGSTLTQKRKILANSFKQELEDFSKNLTKYMSTTVLKGKIIELENIINRYEAENNKLSVINDKNLESGRLSEIFNNSKQALLDLKSKCPVVEDTDIASQMKKTS